MNDRELLCFIADRLSGICVNEMTQSERVICNKLVDANYLVRDENTFETTSKVGNAG